MARRIHRKTGKSRQPGIDSIDSFMTSTIDGNDVRWIDQINSAKKSPHGFRIAGVKIPGREGFEGWIKYYGKRLAAICESAKETGTTSCSIAFRAEHQGRVD
jgi:hypothetical protein